MSCKYSQEGWHGGYTGGCLEPHTTWVSIPSPPFLSIGLWACFFSVPQFLHMGSEDNSPWPRRYIVKINRINPCTALGIVMGSGKCSSKDSSFIIIFFFTNISLPEWVSINTKICLFFNGFNQKAILVF